MHTTPRLALRLPDGTGDSPDVPLWMERLALDLEGSFPVGLAADRPAAGRAGRRYFASDTKVEYVDTGTAWESVGQLADGSVTAAKLAAALKPSGGASASTEALRGIGSGAGQVVGGDDPRLGAAVTALPGSPVDGQEVYYVNTAFDGVLHLRYRASSPNAHKWDVVGGPPGKLLTSGGGYVPFGSWQDIGPDVSLTAPLAGVYAVDFGFHGRMDTGGYETNYHVGVAPGPETAEINPSWTSSHIDVFSRSTERTVAASTAIKLQHYLALSGWTGQIWSVWMRVTPRRVN
jgi:hypothetical protein